MVLKLIHRLRATSGALSDSIEFLPGFLAETSDNSVQDFFQADRWLIACEFFDFCNVRNTPRHVLKSFFISYIIRNMHDFRIAFGYTLHQLGQLIHSYFVDVADIENPTHRTGMVGQISNGLYRIFHIVECPGLSPIAIDSNRLT